MTLIDHLPDFYRQTPEIVQLMAALTPAAQAAFAAGESLLLQLNVATATWGLTAWETALGLGSDPEAPVEDRRARILAKRQGQGTATPQLIAAMAANFAGRGAEVIEHNAEAAFEIKFSGEFGIPPQMELLEAAIDEIKPAHLAYFFTYLYRHWGELRTRTWGELSAHTWGDAREGEI